VGGRKFHSRDNDKKLRGGLLQASEKIKSSFMVKKNGSPLIEGIELEIERKLRQLGLEAEISPALFFELNKGLRHRYFSLVKDKSGAKLAFYARCDKSRDAKEKFIREANFINKIQKTPYKIKGAIPKLISWQQEKSFEWMLREYVEGKPLNASRKGADKEIISEIASLVFQISKVSPSEFKNVKLKKFNAEDFLNKGLLEELSRTGVITPSIGEKITARFKEALPLLKKESKCLAQGDLNLGNIIIGKRKSVWIIDWELVGVNNPAQDICYLWTHFWLAEKHTRMTLLKEYLKKLNSSELLKFKKIFPVVAGYLATGGIQMEYKNEKRGKREKRQKFFRDVLVNSTKSFETLIKT
jgi:aminoglycoside phosphotransferase (APT) family kinase protein